MKGAKKVLQKLCLRPTSQRVAIVEILLSKGNVHVRAASLKKMLLELKANISTANIYNNLNELDYIYEWIRRPATQPRFESPFQNLPT